MSKELEALNEIFDGRAMRHEEYVLIEQAFKRNKPVRLRAGWSREEACETNSVENYRVQESYCLTGYCPICVQANPIDNNFCGYCGNKLDKFWSK